MNRKILVLAACTLPASLSGCIAGAAVGLAGNVVEGAVNVTGDIAEGAVDVVTTSEEEQMKKDWKKDKENND